MPKNVQEACAAIAMDVHSLLKADIGDAALSADWFQVKLEYYYGDAAERMNNLFSAELERFVNKAVENGAISSDSMAEYLSRWKTGRADVMAKNEAVMVRNRFLIRGYRKAGYQTVWKASPNCCEMCRADEWRSSL